MQPGYVNAVCWDLVSISLAVWPTRSSELTPLLTKNICRPWVRLTSQHSVYSYLCMHLHCPWERVSYSRVHICIDRIKDRSDCPLRLSLSKMQSNVTSERGSIIKGFFVRGVMYSFIFWPVLWSGGLYLYSRNLSKHVLASQGANEFSSTDEREREERRWTDDFDRWHGTRIFEFRRTVM